MKTENENTIHSRFAYLRTKVLKKSQEAMAKEMKTSQGQISQFEKGMALPTGGFMQRLGEVLPEANFNWLILGEGEPLTRPLDPKRFATSKDLPEIAPGPKREFPVNASSGTPTTTEPTGHDDRVKRLEEQLKSLQDLNYQLVRKLVQD